MKPPLSIIIPTRNEEFNLQRCLKSISNIKEKKEVLIIDAYSTDNTINIAESFDFTRFMAIRGSAGKARNVGIKESKSDIVAMLDADTEITKTWYRNLINSMRYFDIVAGHSYDPEGKSLPRVPIYVDGQDITYPQCNIAYRKNLFEKVGYLREDMSVAEDCEFHYRCTISGYTIYYNPNMQVLHYERSNRLGMIKKAYKNGFGRYELEKIHPGLKHQHQHGLKPGNILRLSFGALGYLKGKVFGGNVKT